MDIIRYTAERKEEWDEFVDSSRNGTFMLRRDYVDYHRSRMHDHSLMFVSHGKLIALLPANLCGNTLYSHQGLTYGGLILSYAATAAQVLEVFAELGRYLQTNTSVQTLVYRAIPYIYHRYPAQEDLYALFRCRAVLVERKVSSAIYNAHRQPFRKLRNRQTQKAIRQQLSVDATPVGYAAFWPVLEEVLASRHHTRPVHSLAEMEMLAARFPNHIRLHTVSAGTEVLAGCVVYESTEVAHIQYIAASEAGKEKGAPDLLFSHLINNIHADKPYIDFGVSVEQGGWVLNRGLQFQKEGFGARAVVYDTYEVKTNNLINIIGKENVC